MTPRAASILQGVLFFLLPMFVLLWTSIEGLVRFTIHFALLMILIGIGLSFFQKESLQLVKVTGQVLTILLLVGGTGWFLSPFFFLLYLVPLYLGFLYTPLVAFSFLTALIIIFSSSSIGTVDIAYDIMTLLSLLLVIPLIIYLRRKYLILRQTKKDILILDSGSGIKDTDTISRLLANRVTNLGVTIRQPLTFVKQAATVLLEENLPSTETAKYLHRIRTTAAESLEQIRQFEGATSVNEVLTNRKIVKPPKK